MRSVIAATVLLLLSTGCGDEAVGTQIPQDVAKPKSVKRVTKTRDAEGLLLEGDINHVGLVMPIGFKDPDRIDNTYFYKTHYKMDKLLRYFGDRLDARDMRRQGDGVVYRNTIPKAARGNVIRINLWIYPLNGAVAVNVEELLQAPKSDKTPEELLEEFADHWKEG